MTNKQKQIDQLIYLFSRLPGLGRRSAMRIVLHLLSDKEKRLETLVNSLNITAKSIKQCEVCGNLDSQDICYICSDQSRDSFTIAIVENVADLWAIERCKAFHGKYHVIGTNLSAISGNSPELLKLSKLKSRLLNDQVSEIIIALSSTLDGQTTSFYISEYLKDCNIKFSRLASGIPIGGELDYLDEGTLSAALHLRQPFD
jgi:recombination protein RecR